MASSNPIAWLVKRYKLNLKKGVLWDTLMKRLLQMEAAGGKPGRLWAGKRQPAGRIDDGFTLIVDDKLCFWKIEFSLQAPSTSTTRQPT